MFPPLITHPTFFRASFEPYCFAAATAIAAAKRAFAQQRGQGAAGSFFEKGPVRIHYQSVGSGFPLLLIAGGGLNSTIAGLANPFNSVDEFKGEYRCI
ncbi:MAG TPA: hypothetical protein VKC15_00710, partial [Gemmatimonadales bacterium]|nr:hypothetical protein [Gemmatimonadales bacterium]